MNKYRISYSFTNTKGKEPRRATDDVLAETEDTAIRKLEVECEGKGRVIVKYYSVEILKSK